jgi:hypothetical protein
MKIEKFLVPFLVLIFLSGSFSAISQVYTYKKASKVHYEIITTQNDSIQERINQAAFDFTKFDALRFLNTRRMIPVSGYNSTVVLYSAQELQEKFGKQISPFTILPENEYDQVEFYFTSNKFPEFEIKKIH